MRIQRRDNSHICGFGTIERSAWKERVKRLKEEEYLAELPWQEKICVECLKKWKCRWR